MNYYENRGDFVNKYNEKTFHKDYIETYNKLLNVQLS